MTDRPIIMSTESVKAILDGRKTQTRRVVKKPEQYDNIRYCDFCCPYGQVGQRLWVRETWRLVGRSEDRSGCCRLTVEYRCDSARKTFEVPRGVFNKYTSDTGWGVDSKWRPSIFMPRWASRITLEITGVRVERLQEITNRDAIAEGISAFNEIPAMAFGNYWDSLNAKKYPWSSNPWVWCISFRRK